MSVKDELVALIIDAVKELGDQDDIELPADMDHSTALFGESGFLNSMSLVSLVVSVEQSIEDRYGRSVSLADEKALSRRNSPYRTVGSLAEYAAEQLGQG
ncbi:MAG: acyl carrier protein [Gammaproteobacteria bacterium]